MENNFFNIQPRIAVYPCCANDISNSSLIISKTNLADQVIFCDKRRYYRSHSAVRAERHTSSPHNNKQLFHNAVTQDFALPCSFMQGDFRATLDELPIFDVLFYRKDSQGEGGSGLRVLGDFLPRILSRMLVKRAYIITDGSNSFDNNFKNMQQPEGLRKYGRHFQLHSTQLSEHPELKIFTVDWDNLPETK